MEFADGIGGEMENPQKEVRMREARSFVDAVDTGSAAVGIAEMVPAPGALSRLSARSASSLQDEGVLEAFELLAVPFQDAAGRFWEKAAAFWLISAFGLASGVVVAATGYAAPGALLSCGLAWGILASMASFEVDAVEGRNWRYVRRLSSATVFAVAAGALLLGAAYVLMFLPSMVMITTAAVLCCFVTFCAAAYLMPMAAGGEPIAAGAAFVAANWHRAAGTMLLAFVYMTFAVPAAAVAAFSPERAEGKLRRLCLKPSWMWLLPLADAIGKTVFITKSFQPAARCGMGGVVSLVARRFQIFVVALPATVLGMWYALLVTAARILTRLGSDTNLTQGKE